MTESPDLDLSKASAAAAPFLAAQRVHPAVLTTFTETELNQREPSRTAREEFGDLLPDR